MLSALDSHYQSFQTANIFIGGPNLQWKSHTIGYISLLSYKPLLNLLDLRTTFDLSEQIHRTH